jgi:predicted ABC-type ATPase
MGAMLLQKEIEYFNPDQAAKRILFRNPEISQAEANGAAWLEGKRLLERAIQERLNFAFETTLGGKTIAGLLETALSSNIEVRIWYVGLGSADLHVQRVRSRVRLGGHDIPEQKIRERYVQSRLNLVRLLPKLTEIRVYDNSEEADPNSGNAPHLKLILHCVRGKITEMCEVNEVPDWAKPIVVVAMKMQAGS